MMSQIFVLGLRDYVALNKLGKVFAGGYKNEKVLAREYTEPRTDAAPAASGGREGGRNYFLCPLHRPKDKPDSCNAQKHLSFSLAFSRSASFGGGSSRI